MTNGMEGAKVRDKQSDELIKQIRAVNAVLAMDVLPRNVTGDVALLDSQRLAKEYPVRFQVYLEVTRFIRESVGGKMDPLGVAAHGKRISEWRNRIFEGDRPAGHVSIGEFLDRPEFKNRTWNKRRATNRADIFTLVRDKLSQIGVSGIDGVIQGYKTVLYKEEDLKTATEQLPL